ncbi:MAG: neuraminidase-like domain-containing protein, partial [Kofleriaceae bacterium]
LQKDQPELADKVLALSLVDAGKRLARTVRDVPDDVRAKLETIDLTSVRGEVVQHLEIKLAELGVSRQHIDKVARHARRTKPGLQPNQAVGTSPSVGVKLAKAQLDEVSTIAKLSAAAAASLSAVAGAPGQITDAALSDLVTAKKLTDAEARAVGLSSALYQLVDGDATLASGLRSASYARFGNRPPTSTAELAQLTPLEWTTALSANGAKLPAGTTAAQLGQALATRFASLHPIAALVGRLPVGDVKQVNSDVTALAPLFKTNPHVVGVDFGALSTTGIDASTLPALRSTYDRLVQLDRSYPGMQLATVVDDATLTPAAKAAEVHRRIGLVTAVTQQLAGIQPLQLDLSDTTAASAALGLGKLGASAGDQAMVLETFKGYQRTYTIALDVDDANALLGAGYTAASQIARLHFTAFQSHSGIEADRAKPIWDRARTSLANASLTVASILDVFHGLFDQTAVGNTPPSAAAYLKQLAGFEDLFGSLAFCDCEECRSILGPAAYFVDLMKFIDENLRDQFATLPNHPLDLKTRRPDLWTLEMSCDNTNNRVATLDLVNAILENFIAQKLGYTGLLSDRGAIETLVYKTTLQQQVDSFAQPLLLPLARVDAYLAELAQPRAAIAVALAASARVFTEAELALSSNQLALITTTDVVLADLSRLYGITFSGTVTAVDHVDAQLMMAATGLTRADLALVVGSWFVAAGGATVTIKAAKRDANSVQNDVEWVQGLTADALDRIHRFTRLMRNSGWSIVDLDLALATFGNTALASIDDLAELHALRARLQLSVPEVCALVGALPMVPAGSSLFDSLFNAPSFVAGNGVFPQSTTHFVHPAFRQSTPAKVDPNLPRLLTGLAVDLSSLASLARNLAPHLAQETASGFDPQAVNDDDRYFVLSAPNLTLLYRHARLARALGISVDDLFQLLGFLALDRVAGMADLRAVIDLYDWWKQSGYLLDDIAAARGQPPRDPLRYPAPAAIASGIVSAAATSLTFADTMFAVALGTTERGSRDLIASNPTLIESATNAKWRLAAGIDLANAAITVPPTATVPTPPSGTRALTDTEVRNALASYQAKEALARALAKALATNTEKVVALAALAGQSLTSDTVVRAVRGDGPIAPLIQVVAAIRPLSVAFAAAPWDAAAIDFVRQNPTLFSADAIPQTAATPNHPNAPYLELAQLQSLSTYARIAERQLGTTTTDPVDLRLVLSQFDSALPGFPSSSDSAMARILGVAQGLIVGLRSQVKLPPLSANALEQLDRAAQLASQLGVDGETFGALVSETYDDLAHAADALLAVLHSRYPDESTRAAKLDEAEQPVREAKRNALAAYLIHSITPKVWNTIDDLYEYFLIDVDAGGCSTTSPVVAATMSAQLYVYRAIMHLEQDGLLATDPNHIVLRLPADAAAEWDWRKNYRVWQANREVFLWPENYLEPDLRDDKTPQFEDLESQLLQTDIGDQNVLDAYTSYLAAFEEVASLSVAGAYHEVRWQGKRQIDVLHLFGVSATDPPAYYYRTCENLIASGRDPNTAAVWAPWRKLNVQITGRKVSPIVHLGRLHVFWFDVKTRSLNEVQNGASMFSGYRHKMAMKFTTLRPDETWTAPQDVQLSVDRSFSPGRGQIDDLFIVTDTGGGVAPLDPLKQYQTEALDDYTLSGPNWDWGWLQSLPSKLQMQFRNFLEHSNIDLFERTAPGFDWDTPSHPYLQLLCAKKGTTTKPLYYGTPVWMFWPYPGYANAVIDEERMDLIDLELYNEKSFLQNGMYTGQIATIPDTTRLLAVPGSEEDGILQVGNDILLLQGSVTDKDGLYVLRRLGTTLVQDIARRLFEDGLDSLLDTQTQLALAEAGLPITLVGNRIEDRSNSGKLDFTGPYGVYYRELFFHIPFLIANALNSRGKYDSCQRWYSFIFDPTSTEAIDVTGVAPSEVAHRLLDRVWRYREFRGLDVPKLRDMLTDPAAISAYEKDPFNPWAIARVRISALQKAIVMKYVGNLLDWGDSLFARFTMESVNEAQMLYVMASDVLGTRPAEIGDCGDGVEPMTYEHIGPLVDGSSEILVELETWTLGWRYSKMASAALQAATYAVDQNAIAHAAERAPLSIQPVTAVTAEVSSTTRAARRNITPAGAPTTTTHAPEPANSDNLFRGFGWSDTRTTSWAPAFANAKTRTVDKLGGRTFGNAWKGKETDWVGRFGWHIIRQFTPVFCVPVNQDLLALWDRVADRLYKIRNCMDLDGNKRELALFAPPINPAQLAAMQAAELTLEDVLGSTNGDLPPYRFLYLVDRAKAFAASLSGFGSAMLAALEKKDGENLNRLRLTQAINLAQMTTQTRQFEIDSAQQGLQALQQQLAAAQYRSDYYSGLVSDGRNGWENAQSAGIHLASGIRVLEGTLGFLAGSLHLMPDIGSPFAMKYGGVAIGSSLTSFADATGSLAAAAEGVAASAGLEAHFARRSDGWTHQKALADFDVSSLQLQIKAASIRVDIATNALALHRKGIDQLTEVLEFTDGKFTDLGLYTYLAAQLQTLYRGAFQNALAVAKLAEQAYRFERGDDTLPGLSLNYWNPTYAGLLAGEQMLIDLQTLERRFLETNYRTLEVDQAFALSQVDPQALISLRENGDCTFTIGELFYNLYYPGQYKRRIRAVRLTIPGITGPYVNVSATLNLLNSWLR